MKRYLVPVMNRETGEQILMDVECSHPVEAQIQALHDAFHEYGWCHIEASLALTVVEEQAA